MQPGETFRYECVFTVYRPELFEADLLLYLEEDGIRPVMLTVKGVGTEPAITPRVAEHAPKTP